MSYLEFKNNFIEKVYKQYLDGNIASARTELAKIYREGKDAPRATIYRIVSTHKDAKDIFRKKVDEFEKQNKLEDSIKLLYHYKEYQKELFGNEHPLVNSAFKELSKNLISTNISEKNRHFTNFIFKKQMMPLLGKFKCLAKFL